MAQAITKGICDAGADVLFIGLAGTEQIYAAVTAFKAGAGIEVTASHNPIDYNGMKIVKHELQPLSAREFSEIKQLAEQNSFIHLNFLACNQSKALHLMPTSKKF